MAVDSVSSGKNAYSKIIQTQTQQAQQPDRAQQEKRAQEQQAKQQEVKKPQPVTNTQGQKTGTIINTSA